MLALFGALLCVIANGFFVAAEFALAKVRPTSLEALAKEGDGAAKRAFEITKRLDAYWSATQLGITWRRRRWAGWESPRSSSSWRPSFTGPA